MRLEDPTLNISNDVEDQRILRPDDNNFYFISKNDIPQRISYKLNLIKPFERSKVKAFFPIYKYTDKNFQETDLVNQMECFQNKFLSPMAKSSQINSETSRNKRFIDVNRKLKEETLQRESKQRWKKQARNLRPLYKQYDQAQDGFDKQYEKTRNFTLLEIPT